MDWQQIINIGAGAALSVIGWFARILWDAQKELRDDLARLREELPKDYVTKHDFREELVEIKGMLNRIYERLEHKADK